MNSAPTDPLIGKILDERYVVRSKIARGGMAVVYLGDDLRLGRKVAIKIMHAHLVDDENFTRRFEQEARSAAVLAHPNVVNVFDQGSASGLPYMVMEYLPGITLRDLLKQNKQLSPEQAREISISVLSGLAAAHEAGIVHRDLKPENVLLADDGRIKIGDFGLARAVSANTTTGQALLGTIAYLSPELVTRGIADARSDLYAFGVMLFEMLTGQQPYTGEQPMQIAYQHAHSDMPLPSSRVPSLPPELDELVHWTTQRDAAGRPSNAREALQFLKSHHTPGAFDTTTALPTNTANSAITPATTVLGATEVQSLVALKTGSLQTPASAVDKAMSQTAQRKKRGRLGAFFSILLVLLAAGGGWWWGQGPGSLSTVPDIAGLELSAAESMLTDASFTVSIYKCSSLEVPAGKAVLTEPAAGSRINRGSEVRLCESTGPEMLPVPKLVDLPLDEAKNAIVDAKFTVGEVLEERFDDGTKGNVILAVDAEGNGLGKTYPEQGTIDLIVSAGSVPVVSGLSVEQATKALSDAGLVVNNTVVESHSDSVEKGRVIAIKTNKKTLRVGNKVGLQVSLGPKLYAIPDVTDMPLKEALQTLRDAGFEPVTGVPEQLHGVAKATGTTPAAGKKVEKGTTIQVSATINF